MRKLNLFLATILLASCGGPTPVQNNVTVVPQSPQQPSNIQAQVADLPGFDVPAFSNLLKTTSNPDAIQQAINAPGNQINNLDLDADGNIDYLRVDQINNYTIQVVDETGTGANAREVVATLRVDPQSRSYSVVGSPDYCGSNYTYQSQSGITLGEFLFLHWLLTPHPIYHPHWGYHYYPRGYAVYHTHYTRPYTRTYIQERKVYRTQTTTTTQQSSGMRQSSKNTTPQQTQPVPAARTSVSAPTQSQRSFQVNTNNTGAPRSTAFGKQSTPAPSASAPRSSYSPSSSSSSSSSSHSYGSSKSSWGGSSSRSSSFGGRRR